MSRGQKRLWDFFQSTSSQRRQTEDESDCGPSEDTHASQPSTTKTNREDSKKKYEGKRVRAFQNKWKTEFDWVQYCKESETMWCGVCREYDTSGEKNPFLEGTGVFRKQMLQSHCKSKSHRGSVEAKRIADLAQKNVPSTLPGVARRMEKHRLEQMKRLMNSVYFIVREELSFRTFPSLIEVQIKNGLSMGSMYTSDNACRRFVEFIYEDIMEPIFHDIRTAKHTSILVDSSTDSSNRDLELMYARYLKNGVPVNVLFGLQELEHANAPGHLNAIKHALEAINFTNWQSSVVGLGTDGAAVMIGRERGLATLMRKEVPWLYNIHCMAHRLELGAMDVIKEHPEMQRITDMLQGMYKTYKASPKSWRDLQKVAEVMETRLLRPGNVQGTRWLPHIKAALRCAMQSYEAISAHMENQIEQRAGSAEMLGRARKSLHILKDHRTMRFACFILDVLDILSRLSLKLQEDELTVAGGVRALKTCDLHLQALKSSLGEEEGAFVEEVSEGDEYKGVPMDPLGEDAITSLNALRSTILDDIAVHLYKRFENMQSDVILAACDIVDVARWPADEEELGNYGTASLDVIINHFRDALEPIEINKIHHEWAALKAFITSMPPTRRSKIWQQVFQDKDLMEECQYVMRVVEIVLLLPLSTAACERGFSLLKRTKTDWRSRLSVDMVHKLMCISMHGPSMEHFDPSGAVEKWWSSTTRRTTSSVVASASASSSHSVVEDCDA